MNTEKYLISGNFKAIRAGEFVQASEDDGEFILTHEIAEGFAIATLKEILKANGAEFKSRDKHDTLTEGLMAHLKTLNLPKVNQMTDTQIVEDVIEAGIAAGHDDDKMLCEIMNKGISFKAAGKLFKSVMESKGHRVSASAVADSAAKIMAGSDSILDDEGNVESEAYEAFSPETPEDVQAMVERIMGEVKGANEKQALAAIRKFAKANEITMPKSKSGGKGSGNGGGGGIQAKMQAWMLENRDCDKEGVTAQIQSLKPDITEGQLSKHVANALNAIGFARAWSGEASAQ